LRAAWVTDPLGENTMSATEAVLRAVNDRIHELGNGWQAGHHFICECADPCCLQTVAMPPGVYDEIRALPRHFTLVPGHERPASERFVRSGHTYLVVLRPDVPESRETPTHERSDAA
jgi:hypothetical protein